MLLACNHPNSFLDAILLDLLFHRPVWSLARGDVFANPAIRKLLTKLRILPVYRQTEGFTNLGANYHTFEACLKVFRQDGLVMIFSEGRCVNEWHLRPLRKGTSRLAQLAWEEGLPLRILPVGINYSSFSRFGKNVRLNFGEPVDATAIHPGAPGGVRHRQFNDRLTAALQPLVLEIGPADGSALRGNLGVPIPLILRAVIVLPAIAGILIHAPLYAPCRLIARKLNGSDHYDSILLTLLLLLYPVYLLLAVAGAWLFFGSAWAMLGLLIFPALAWCAMMLNVQYDD